jgi:Kef-type K+ transport system membrane component KefB
MAVFDLSVLLFLQLAVLLTVCRGLGLLMRRFGQPQGVSEMVAGVLLDPSLLGALSPQVWAWWCPPTARATLFALSPVGLVLCMFLIGLHHGLFPPAWLTILVMVAILTTLAATPVCGWRRRRAASPAAGPASVLREVAHE